MYASLGGRVLGTLLKRRKSYPQDAKQALRATNARLAYLDESSRRIFNDRRRTIHFSEDGSASHYDYCEISTVIGALSGAKGDKDADFFLS